MTTTANTEPIFKGAPVLARVKITSEVLSRDGVTGTPALLHTAGVNGSLIESIWIIPLGNEPANVIRLFSGETSGYTLIREVSVAAMSGSSNTAAQTLTAFTLPALLHPNSSTGLYLSAGDTLYVAPGTATTAGGYVVFAQGGDF